MWCCCLFAVDVDELGLTTWWDVQPGVGVLTAVPADVDAFSSQSTQIVSSKPRSESNDNEKWAEFRVLFEVLNKNHVCCGLWWLWMVLLLLISNLIILEI